MNRRNPLAAAAGVMACLSACGYSVGYDDYGPARTVAVEVVDNRSFRQRIEIPLTREILAQLPVLGNYRPGRPGASDTVLKVTLDDVQGRSLVGPGGGFPVREGALEFQVAGRLVDGPSGAVLRDFRVVDRAEFRSPVGETEFSANAEAVHDLARKIVLALEQDF